MARVKDKLLELEEEGIIIWQPLLSLYVLRDGDRMLPFDLNEYLSTVGTKPTPILTYYNVSIDASTAVHIAAESEEQAVEIVKKMSVQSYKDGLLDNCEIGLYVQKDEE